MSTTTSIQWTDRTWNPVRGCSRVSAGCDNCYAMNMAHRFSGAGKPFEGLTALRRGKVDWAGVARFIPQQLGAPLKWRKPSRVFVNSMSDLFHPSLSNEEVAAVFGVMAACPEHTFQVLTKQPKRAAEWFEWVGGFGGVAPYIRHHADDLRALFGAAQTETYRGRRARSANDPWCKVFNAAAVWSDGPLPNVHLGVSAENQKTANDRISVLLDIPAAVRFVSYEPALGPVDFSAWIEQIDHCTRCSAESPPQKEDRCPTCAREGTLISTWGHKQAELQRDGLRYQGHLLDGPQLHWIICGGESGNGARPFDVTWAEQVIEQCRAAGVPCFVKQLGAKPIDSRLRDVWANGTHHYVRPPDDSIVIEALKRTDYRVTPHDMGRLLKDGAGGDPTEWPEALRVRQFPEAVK